MIENARLEAVLARSRRWTKEEAYRHVAMVGSQMVQEVRELRKDARHYRKESPVHVGAIAVVLANDGRLGVFTGANQNLAPGDNPTKMCGEIVSLCKPIELAYGDAFANGELLMLMNAGTVQPDTQSGKEFPTLHPCGIDRSKMRELRREAKMVKSHSVIVSVHPELNRAEVQFFEELLQRHEGEHDIDNPRYVDTTREVWEEGAALLQLEHHGLIAPFPAAFEEPEVRFRAAVTGRLAHVLERQGVIVPPAPQVLPLFA